MTNTTTLSLLVVLGVGVLLGAYLFVQMAPPVRIEVSGFLDPLPPPGIVACDGGTESLDPACRRLAVKQPIYPGASPDFDVFQAPVFGPSDFQAVNAFSLHGNGVRLPYCPAWDPVRNASTGYGSDLPDFPAPELDHLFYFAYAAPVDFPSFRTMRVGGIDLGGDWSPASATLRIGANIDYQVWVSDSPLSCASLGGAPAEVGP